MQPSQPRKDTADVTGYSLFTTSHPTRQWPRGPPAVHTLSVHVFNKEVMDEVRLSELKEGGTMGRTNGNGKAKGPKVYANIIECWQDLINELELKGELPDTLNLGERLIFMVGTIAGKREAQGLWKPPEQTPKDKGRDASIVAEVEKLLRVFPTQRDRIEKTVMDLKSDILSRYDVYIAELNKKQPDQKTLRLLRRRLSI